MKLIADIIKKKVTFIKKKKSHDGLEATFISFVYILSDVY